MKTLRKPKLISTHNAREVLEQKYPKGNPPQGYMFDAYLATFESYGWRQGFHRLTEEHFPNHDATSLCEVCFAAAELSVLYGVPLITTAMTNCITQALQPEVYGQYRSGGGGWGEAVTELPTQIAQAIGPELHERLKLEPIDHTTTPCDICEAAGKASVANWMSGFYGNIVKSNISIIHGLFNWQCPIPHHSD